MTAPSMPVPAPARALRTALLLVALLVAASVVAAYRGGLHGALVFDDADSIAENPSIRDFATSLSPPPGATVSGRPFLNLSFALNYALSGTATWGYHALNVAIHAAAALLLLGIVRRTLALPAAGGLAAADALLVAAAVSLVWALHPLQVESVEYIVQRAESLMGFLYLLTLYAYIRYAGGARAAPAWAAVSFGACLLGMATKEAMATAPLVVFLYDRTFLAGSFQAAWRSRRAVLLVLAATWIPLGIQLAYTGGRPGSAGFGSGVAWWAYLAAQMKAIVLYIRLAAWPRPLVGDYGRILAGRPLEVAVCALLVAALACGTIYALVRRPALGFLGAWFLAILAPTSSVVPISTEIIALHRMYLPLAALVVLGVLALRSALGSGSSFKATIAVAALCLAFATARRVGVYENPLSFWSDVALKAPWNAGAWNNLGVIHAEAGDEDRAAGDFRRALEIAPDFATAHFNMGKALVALGQPRAALVELGNAAKFLPTDPEVHHQLGKALAMEHRAGDAVRELHTSVMLDADRADTWFDLGGVMAEAGSLQDAAYAYGQSVKLSPGYAEARLDYGDVLAQIDRIPEAIEQYGEAARLEPEAADIRNNLGFLLVESGRLAEAKEAFEAAIRLKPDYAEARENLDHVERLIGSGGHP